MSPEPVMSGTYIGASESASDAPVTPNAPWPFSREVLRLDVDGHFPQMAVSGTMTAGLSTRVDWIASLSTHGEHRWRGTIWLKNGASEKLPQTDVDVQLIAASGTGARRLRVAYGGPDGSGQTRDYVFQTPLFRTVDVEIDSVEGAVGVTALATGDHPNRPAELVSEPLELGETFRRAGFGMRVTRDEAPIPLSVAGANQTWDDAELHDAMQRFWSRNADAPQWAIWALFAARHDAGRGHCGVMFDKIGPNQRQGLAVFTDTNLARPPADEAHPDAWIRRMKFFALVHEIGHTFNLAHAWQKAAGTAWIRLQNQPESRCYMNYPDMVAEGVPSFFQSFFYRFSDSDLLFLRHAPESFVQPGQADWFDDHGFRLAATRERPNLALEVRIRPERDVFDFLEPIVLELKLSNISTLDQAVSADVLSAQDAMTVILKRRGRPARQWTPFTRVCRRTERTTLKPGRSIYESLFISAGGNGWDVADPGVYKVQIALHLDGEDIVSNALEIRVAPPRWRTEEVLAQDYFSEDVGRVLAMDGSTFLEGANNTLRELATRFKAQRSAKHALVALAQPLSLDFKQLRFDSKNRSRKISVRSAEPEEAHKRLQAALLTNAKKAMETLGHIDFNGYVQRYCDQLDTWGEEEAATSGRKKLFQTLSKSRSPSGRPILKRVLDAVAKAIEGTTSDSAHPR